MYCIIRRGLLGVLGVNSGTLHLLLLPPVRKFGQTAFCVHFPPPARPPLFYLLFPPFCHALRPWPRSFRCPPSVPCPLPPTSASALLFHILSQCWSPASRGGRRSIKIKSPTQSHEPSLLTATRRGQLTHLLCHKLDQSLGYLVWVLGGGLGLAGFRLY